ncbi:MAG: aminodeoxychorismate/anthranilate synthase component II [Bacteroidetes bacterium]|nr:MAG: aminodeoxychorismate/anthranilate synthase component II [Bacteroidota bacterium]
MNILLIDNYDSFTYNLVHLLEANVNVNVNVVRNDRIELEEVESYDKIIISPGPGLPEDAGVILEVICEYAGSKPILGVCLGHQAIIEAFGGKLRSLNQVFHGVGTDLIIKKPVDPIFEGMPEIFQVGRYHSWIADLDSLPEDIEVIASDKEAMVMGVKHKSYDLRGIQFHPESILTENGKQIIDNWIQI